MIILAVGMPRAGSGWHYNITQDLMRTAGATDAREIREHYHLGSILTEVNCNIGVLSLRRLALVLIPSLLGKTFVIKVHSGPTNAANALIRSGQIKPTYIYRDPRDALLSAHEYGQRAIQNGRPNAFSHLDSIETAIGFIAEYVRYWHQWSSCTDCHQVRYEDLRGNYDIEAGRLANFLKVDTRSAAVQTVIDTYRPEQAAKSDRGLHFYKGISGRFREVFTPEQLSACQEVFGPSLIEMGYE